MSFAPQKKAENKYNSCSCGKNSIFDTKNIFEFFEFLHEMVPPWKKELKPNESMNGEKTLLQVGEVTNGQLICFFVLFLLKKLFNSFYCPVFCFCLISAECDIL